MDNKKKINEITYTDRVKSWLEKTDEEKVRKTIKHYVGLERWVKSLDKVVDMVGKEGNIYYKEFIHVLHLALLGSDSEVLKLKDEIEELKTDKIKLDVEVKRLKLNEIAKDTEISNLKVEVKDKDVLISNLEIKVGTLEDKVSVKDVKISGLEADIVDYKGKLEVSEKEVEDCKSKMGCIGKGKYHVRGTEEFYRDVKIAGTHRRVKNGGRVNKNGEPYLDYREAIKFAEGCDTIQNYARANNVKINRENLINWLKIAEALDSGEDIGVKIGKYKANKGYKR